MLLEELLYQLTLPLGVHWGRFPDEEAGTLIGGKLSIQILPQVHRTGDMKDLFLDILSGTYA